MTVTAFGGLAPAPFGAAGRQFLPVVGGLSSTLIDAANEACILVGYLLTSDGASHIIDTTGSSSIAWRTAAVTFANAGTTFKVGIAAVDTTAGPPVRAVNVADVITNDVVASFTGGGGGVTANAWQTSVPTSGTKTITNGQLVAITMQMTARAGADAINVSNAAAVSITTDLPCVTAFTGAAYSDPVRLPNAFITFADGATGVISGGYVASVGSTQQLFNNASATKEYGNILTFPVPVNIYGIYGSVLLTGDADAILYTDPLGTPAAAKTVSVDLNTIGTAAANGCFNIPFASPYVLAANTPVAAILKPTSGTDIGMNYKTFAASAHQIADTLGTNCYAINRNAGAFAAQNSNKDRFAIGLLVGAADAGGRAVQINNDSLVG